MTFSNESRFIITKNEKGETLIKLRKHDKNHFICDNNFYGIHNPKID
jgi:hypothetical protein